MILGVVDLTNESFLAFISTHRLAVVHFWAVWNAHDTEMTQLLEQHVPVELWDQIAS